MIMWRLRLQNKKSYVWWNFIIEGDWVMKGDTFLMYLNLMTRVTALSDNLQWVRWWRYSELIC